MLKVNVTQEHINKGERYSSVSCPIAWALRDALSVDCYGVNVRASEATWFDNGHWRRTWLPDTAQHFVVEFDKGHNMEPFSFELDANV